MPRKRNCATEGCNKPGKYLGRVYVGEEDGKQRYRYLGYFCTQKERTAAQEDERRKMGSELAQAKLLPGERITCDEWADRYLARY